jgi:hypothetical protein
VQTDETQNLQTANSSTNALRILSRVAQVSEIRPCIYDCIPSLRPVLDELLSVKRQVRESCEIMRVICTRVPVQKGNMVLHSIEGEIPSEIIR